MCDVVDIPAVADRLKVQRGTVRKWLWRKVMPPPRWLVSGMPAWDWPDVERWARATNRMP